MTEEKKKILKKMGFYKNSLGMYYHILLDGEFNFVNTPIENIVYVIYSRAEQDGMKLMQEKMRNIMGIK